MAVNDVQAFGVVAEGVERVSQLLTQFALFETVYLRDTADPAKQKIITPPLVKLYAAILRVLSRAKQYYGRSTGST